MAMDYCKVKTKMRQLIRLAKEVIEETEKEAPDDILLSDLAIEELAEISREIEIVIQKG